MKLIFEILLIFITVLISCTTNDVASGGDDIANGYIQANCVDSLFNNVSGAEAELVGVLITKEGDSSFYTASVTSDAEGICRFPDVPNGQYVISITDPGLNRGAIQSRITVNNDSIINSISLVLRKQPIIKGRIPNWNEYPNMSIVIPGVRERFIPDINGFYTIPNMFVGKYDICLFSDSVVNYLTLEVKNSVNDTVYIRDINFAEDLTSASSSYSFYEQKAEKSFQIIPQYYEPQNEPSWYEDNDFDQVEYLEIDEGSDSLVALWNYPIIVGITDTTLKFYGNDSAGLVTLIKNQLKQLSDNFNLADLEGKINFSVDSVYIITGDFDSAKIPSPTEFSVRLLYHAFGDSLEGATSWFTGDRIAVYSYPQTASGGFWGEKGLNYLMWSIAHSRGCYYIGSSQVNSSLNSVIPEGYDIPDYVMNMRSTSNWSPTNKMIMNFTRGDINPSAELVYNRFPDMINLSFEDSLSQPLANIKLDIYVRLNNFSVPDSIVYSGETDINGYYQFPNNPFVSDTVTSVNDNLLIRSIYDGDTSYTWFPMYEVIDSCFIDNSESYTKKIFLD